MRKIVIFFIVLCSISGVKGKELNDTIFVSKTNKAHFPTITAAIESLPMYCYERVVIYVMNGIYNEKVKIDRDYLTIVGEHRDSTRIEYNQLRENWINNKDDIGPAVVNIFADDIILKNITIENTQPEIGPHAFAIYGTGTRTILKKCTVLSKGGDTVSLWNYKTGMYYHDSCYFMGAVDFVCPRGWCYISNSTFYEVKETAAVWHAAPTNEKQKFVLQNCDFQGADSFYLARHHYEAQFYFMACTFSQLMQNKSIEHVVNKEHPEKNRPYVYGNRYYFYNCSRTGGNYNWFANNTGIWPKGVTPDTISPIWTFDGVWNPTDDLPLEVIKKDVQENFVYLWFNELVMPVGNVILETQSRERITYFLGSGRNRLEFKAKSNISEEELNKPMKIVSGRIQNIQATVAPRFLNSRF